jgi:protein-S-isoprenylcysteine O-methyltransferase Ste14
MAVTLFMIAVCLELIYILLFILTIRQPGFRFWPPPKAFSWQFFLAWLMAGVVGAFCLFLGMLDYNSGFLPHILLRLPFALVFSLAGTGIGCWGATVFNLRSTLGLGKRLVTRGPYQFTRNPQYLCDSLNALGFMILANSWMVWVIGILGIILNLLAPLTEEPWLEAHFGDEYRVYKRRVPRFF